MNNWSSPPTALQMYTFKKNSRGFTLIEVMVAMTIFAVSASALMLTDGNTIKHTRILQEKVLAAQVGNHYLNTLYTEPDIENKSFVTNFYNRKWTIQQKSTTTSSSGLYKLVVQVYVGDKKESLNPVPLSELSTFIRAPLRHNNHETT